MVSAGLTAVKAFPQFAWCEVNLPEECIWVVGGDAEVRVGCCCCHICDLLIQSYPIKKRMFLISTLPLWFSGN